MHPTSLPDRPLDRFVELYEALNAGRGWTVGSSTMRYAAIAAVCCPGRPREVANAIRRLSEEIRRGSGWTGPFQSHVSFSVAAQLLQHGDRAAPMLAELRRVAGIIRQIGLRRGGIYEGIAVLVMRMQNDCKPVAEKTVHRLQAIYEELKRHHWWLTGPEDLPACAILTSRDEPPEKIGNGIEQIYQALRSAGFSTGDPLQTAANVLYLADRPAHELASRYAALAAGFRAAGVRIWQSDYDELAMLAFLDHRPAETVRRVLAHREVIASLKPTPDASATFSLASSTAFLELVQRDRSLHALHGLKAISDLQAVQAAQHAAMVAAVTASTAAVVVTTTSS